MGTFHNTFYGYQHFPKRENLFMAKFLNCHHDHRIAVNVKARFWHLVFQDFFFFLK